MSWWIALPAARRILYTQVSKQFGKKVFEGKIKAGTTLTLQLKDPRIQVVFILEDEMHPVY